MTFSTGYKKFVIKQRITELEKALRRTLEGTDLYNKRREELDNLNKDLDGIIDEEK